MEVDSLGHALRPEPYLCRNCTHWSRKSLHRGYCRGPLPWLSSKFAASNFPQDLIRGLPTLEDESCSVWERKFGGPGQFAFRR
jgi:hypothetical protein